LSEQYEDATKVRLMGRSRDLQASRRSDHGSNQLRAYRVLGIDMLDAESTSAIAYMAGLMRSAGTKAVYFANAYTLALASKDSRYCNALNNADAVFGDGTGVRWAGRQRGVTLRANLAGTDIVPAFLSRNAGLTCFLLGGTPTCIERASATFGRLFPDCTLVGSSHGYLTQAGSRQLVTEINRNRPNVLLVGMGNPLQEAWIHQYRDMLDVGLCVGVGGLFAYWAEMLDRAPFWMRKLGIEWLHIVRRQPWKAPRYFIDAPVFLARSRLSVHDDLALGPAMQSEPKQVNV
jgi:N-acetylglucosaminyldiphosphoundecaprenol N-acetyl-beta-D-mannosaminyltransferase